MNNILKYTKETFINEDISKVFDFFSNENNLEKITPEFLNFKVLGKTTDKIETGTKIFYKLKIHKIPVRWTTEIKEFIPNKKFIDVQVKGPYTYWHHTHTFIPTQDGVLMKDEVDYIIPMGFFGKLFLKTFIQKDIENIFNYRTQAINHFFGKA